MDEDQGIEWLDFWATMPGWRVREAAAILILIDPDTVQFLEDPSVKKRYERLVLLPKRCRVMDELPSYPLRPSVFLRWCKNNGIEVPDLVEARVSRLKRPIDYRKRYRRLRKELLALQSKPGIYLEDEDFVGKEPDWRRMRSINILLCVLADEHEFGKKGNNAVKDIKESAASLGLKLEKDAIRKAINGALELRAPVDDPASTQVHAASTRGASELG